MAARILPQHEIYQGSRLFRRARRIAPWPSVTNAGQSMCATTRSSSMSIRAAMRFTIFTRLMCHKELDYGQLSSDLDIDFPGDFAAEIASLGEMEDDGLLVRDRQRLTITDAGRLVIRNIAMHFDTYHSIGREPRFSKTI